MTVLRRAVAARVIHSLARRASARAIKQRREVSDDRRCPAVEGKDRGAAGDLSLTLDRQDLYEPKALDVPRHRRRHVQPDDELADRTVLGVGRLARLLFAVLGLAMARGVGAVAMTAAV